MNNPWYRKFLFLGPKPAPPSDGPGDEADSLNSLGVLHSSSDTYPRDLAAALGCFRKAAEAGHSIAQNNLAMMLARGDVGPKNPEEATVWFLRAANQGDAGAQFNLAARSHRANMRGLAADASEGRVEALKWFQLAAAQGYRKADEWCERLRLDMNASEVAEANRRAAAFVPSKELSGQAA